MTEQPQRRYAKRCPTRRHSIRVHLPDRVYRYVKRDAARTGRSLSSVMVDLLEEAIFGPSPEPQPEAKAS